MAVTLAQLIQKGGIFNDVEGSSAKEVYRKIVDRLELPESIPSDDVYKALCDREDLMSTAVGNCIAIPHCRVPLLKNEEDQKVCVVRLKNPIDMSAPDGLSVSVMFIILAQNLKDHLKVLSDLGNVIKAPKFRKLLAEGAEESQLLDLIRELSK